MLLAFINFVRTGEETPEGDLGTRMIAAALVSLSGVKAWEIKDPRAPKT